MSISSLEVLPVELLYRIIDNIDTETVFLSLRRVCKRFYAIINNHNRYQLDFRYISKTDFYQVCHLIHPENVTGLILSDGNETVGQIGLFLSIFDLHLFTRLTSLTLIKINQSESKIFLNHIITCSIISLSIEYEHDDEQKLNIETIDLLSSTIEKLNNLRKFEVKIKHFLINSIHWPVNSTIQHLTINFCTPIQFFIILRDLSHIQTLAVNDLNTNENFIAPSSEIISSLKSLSIEQSSIHFSTLQFFLSLTPSLIHLKLIGWPLSEISYNGSRWQEFIQTKLPDLNKFEFFFRILMKEQTINDLQSIIASYQTLFWVEHKHWYVNCDYINDISTLHLYSLPICETKITLNSDMNKISCSTLDNIDIDRRFLMNNISHLYVNFIPSIICTTSKQNEQSNIQYFSNVRELKLCVKDDWPENSIEYLSIIIDLSHLIKLSLNSEFDVNSVRNAANIIMKLIERTHHFQSLVISYPLSYLLCEYNMEWIYTMISSKVKHLEIDLYNLNHMKISLSRLNHLSSVTFMLISYKQDAFIQCIKENKRNYVLRKNGSSISLWFDRNHDDLFRMKYDVKRVKLTHDYNTNSIHCEPFS